MSALKLKGVPCPKIPSNWNYGTVQNPTLREGEFMLSLPRRGWAAEYWHAIFRDTFGTLAFTPNIVGRIAPSGIASSLEVLTHARQVSRQLRPWSCTNQLPPLVPPAIRASAKAFSAQQLSDSCAGLRIPCQSHSPHQPSIHDHRA